MTQQHTVTTYTFNELNELSKESARAWYREGSLGYDWSELVIDDAKTIGALIGIDIGKVYFSGFSSQGDGACFEGSYQYKKGSVKAVKDHAPENSELHKIAQTLADIQKPYFYDLVATISHQGRYYHAHCTIVDVDCKDHDISRYCDFAFIAAHDAISEVLRDYMRWIYRSLESEHDYLMSDEQVDESITCNEYEFNQNGSIY